MPQKLEDALKKVTALDGVKAAFVFDQYHAIVTRDVPADYDNNILKRIAIQMTQLSILSWEKGGVITQEFRLSYDRYAVYCRLFGDNFYLVVFMAKELESADYRQPINLALLVLEKALRNEAQNTPETILSHIARLAEQTIKNQAETDESFAGMVRRHAILFFGDDMGREIVDNGIEDEVLVLPLIAEKDMRKLMEYVLERIPHPILKQIMERDMQDMLLTALKQT